MNYVGYMHIIHIASEIAPIAKAGGLGDVIYSLAKEQLRLGQKVTVIIPKYDIIKLEFLENLQIHTLDLWSFEDSIKYHNTVWSATLDNIPLLLIEPHLNQHYFNRGQIYGCSDDVDRFLYFCRAAMEFLFTEKIKPDILHIHDWPIAICAPLARTMYHDLNFDIPGIVFTVHNLEHQGKCSPRNLNRIGLRGYDFLHKDSMQDPTDHSLINILKGGLTYSDSIVTVSPQYALEISTPDQGGALNEVIQHENHKLQGILNGIDQESWNPATDRSIHKHYPSNPTFIAEVLAGKRKNRDFLSKQLSLAPSSEPLVIAVTRLSHQKAPHLIEHAIHHTLKRGGQFVLISTTHEPELEETFLRIQKRYQNQHNFAMSLTFDEPLARLAYAAADIIIIPSIFEPCGLTQMISMRYGTVPIVRRTGGLAATVFDSRNGFTFDLALPTEVEHVLDRAFSTYRDHPKTWSQLMQNGLSADFSWTQSAQLYQQTYQSLI